MNKQEQIAYVKGMFDNLEKKLIELIEKGQIPERWDGMFFKLFVVFYFNLNNFTAGEKRKFKNDMREIDWW